MKGLFRKPVARASVLLLAIFFAAASARATTAVMLTDEQLVVNSRVILLGEVRSVKSQWDPAQQFISTYVKIRVQKIIKGQLQNEVIVFKQLGGRVGEDATVIFGAPEYSVGQNVLLFLETARDNTLRVSQLFQGKYDVVTDQAGKGRVLRRIDHDTVNILGSGEGPEITNRASLNRFTKKIKRVMRERAADPADLEVQSEPTPIVEIPPDYVDDAEGSDFSAQYSFLGNYRWTEPDTRQPILYKVNPAGSPTANGGVNEMNLAFAGWSNVQTTALVLGYGGSTTSYGFKRDGVTSISYNDPLDQMSDPVGCGGTLAIGGVSSASSPITVIGGQSFYRIYEGDVVFNRNFQCFLGISANLAEVAAHEIGHSLGFGHSSDPNALMAPTAHGQGRGAQLGADDVAAVSFLYPGSKSGTTPPTPVAPAAPSSLTATLVSSNAINLTWVDNSGDEQGFRLERKTGSGGTFGVIATLPAGQTGYSDASLPASTTFYYRITAYNAAGNSAYSNQASASTSGAPAPSNNSAFISQSAPASLAAGQTVSVSVTMQNTGTTTWTPGSYFLGSQNLLDNTTWGLNRVNLPASVAPGANAVFFFNITAPAAAGTYNFQWRMLQNSAGYFGALSTNVAITVGSTTTPPATALSITTTALPSGARGVPYSRQITASGGTQPYSWSLASGALPPGMSLTGTGVLGGTPTLSGTYSFTVRVRDAAGTTASRLLKMAVK